MVLSAPSAAAPDRIRLGSKLHPNKAPAEAAEKGQKEALERTQGEAVEKGRGEGHATGKTTGGRRRQLSHPKESSAKGKGAPIPVCSAPAPPSPPPPAALESFRTTDAQRELYAALGGLTPLPELREPQTLRSYAEAALEDVLYPIVEAHDVIIVAGAYFGDEGKGKTVEAVSRHPRCACVARVNSGENAGHTVYDGRGRRFVFNLLPSGILSEGVRCLIGPECVMDPISFLEAELQQLIDAEIPYQGRIGVGNVYVVTPYHKLLDLVLSKLNASTLKGISPAHAGKVSKQGIRLDHIFNDEAALRSQLQKGLEVYLGMLKQKNMTDKDVVQLCKETNSGTMRRVPPYVVNFATAEDKIEYLVELYKARVRENPAFPKRCDAVREMAATVQRGDKVLLEGPQSFWLSNACDKFWVSSTSANTSAAGIFAASQLNFQHVKTVVINVHKAPASSRVGIGACPSSFVAQDFFSSRNIRTLDELPKDICVDFDAIQSLFFNYAFPHANDPDRFNGIAEPIEYTDGSGTYNINAAMAIASSAFHGELGAVTRKPRICGFFDCVLHNEVNAIQGPYLTISALDRGDAYDRIGITIAYVYFSLDGVVSEANGRRYQNGDIIRAGDPVPSEAVLAYCHPIVKLVDGWKDTPIASTKRRKGASLPPALCEFLSTVEHFTGCKVLSIGNGPGGDDIIYLNQS